MCPALIPIKYGEQCRTRWHFLQRRLFYSKRRRKGFPCYPIFHYKTLPKQQRLHRCIRDAQTLTETPSTAEEQLQQQIYTTNGRIFYCLILINFSNSSPDIILQSTARIKSKQLIIANRIMHTHSPPSSSKPSPCGRSDCHGSPKGK